MSSRWAVNLFFFVNGVVLASWASRLPRIQEIWGIDNSQIGLILLAHAIGAFIGMPLTGWLIAKYGSRKITRVSGLCFPLFFIVIPFMPGYLYLFIPFFLLGMSNGIMDVAMNAQAVKIEARLEKPIMTMFHALFSIGMVVGGIVGASFISFESSLIFHFSIVGIIGYVLLIISSFFLYVDQPSKNEEVMLIWPKGAIIGLGVIAFCCMMGEGAMADWSAIYLKDIMFALPDYQAYGLTAFAATMTIGRLFGDKGRLMFGDKDMMRFGAVLSLAGMVFILSTANIPIVIIGFGLVGLGLSNIVPIVYSLAGNYPGLNPGVGIAMATTIGYTGFMFGPPVIGFLADAFDLRIALSLMAFLFVIMLLLVYQYRPDKPT